MKRKIGEIYNKPVVIGDKNLVTKNETHISELQESNEGGSSEIKEWYYAIDVEKMVQDLSLDTNEGKLAIFNIIGMYNPTAYLIAGGYDDNYQVGERNYVDLYNVFFINRLRAIKLSNILCAETISGDNATFSIFKCYGSLEERNKMFKDLDQGSFIEYIKPYITEMSKEQYYGAIQIPTVELNKE